MHLGRELESQADFAVEARQLAAHGVILGMPGSGKTGLAITLLEELIEQGVPLMLVDPKGELANLGLLFPEAQAEQLEPWFDSWDIAAEVAQRVQAERSQWKVERARVAALNNRMELRIYTPGSRVGQPINLLGRFQRPDAATLADEEARADLLSGIVQGLLALVGVVADPLRSAEALVLCQIIDQAWEQRSDLTLEGLVHQIVDPPFRKIGVFPVETFYPSASRLELATKLNALVDSPSFSAWAEGQPLDIQRLQVGEGGKVPVSVFYLPHLTDAERMFFISVLLHHVRNWSRGLAGSGQLKSLLYLDEVAGILPPHPANPASKQPLLTLLKQSGGLGVLLATHSVADVDYKGLVNASNWWVGRLHSALDRQRVAKGLTLAAAGLDAPQLQKEFEQLQPRHFLVKTGDLAQPVRIHTRSTASLMRGPVKRSELPRLSNWTPPRPEEPEPQPESANVEEELEGQSAPPPLPAGFAQAFLDPRAVFSTELGGALERYAQPHRDDGLMFWRPALWGELQLHFDEKMGGFALDEAHHYLFFPLGEQLPDQWLRLPLEPVDLLPAWNLPSMYEDLPTSFDEDVEFTAAQEAMLEDVYRRVSSSQWVQVDLKLYGGGGESEMEFRHRVQLAIEERIDEQVAGLQSKADREITALQERLSRFEGQTETQRRQTESLWTAGASVLGFFTGKKRALTPTLPALQEGEGELAQLQRQMQEVHSQLELEVKAIIERESQALDRIEARPVRLERHDIKLTRFGVLWIPVSRRV